MTEIEIVGDTVHRTAGEWTPAVHALLTHLRAKGIDWIPEPLGFDEQGREIVSLIDGTVPTYPMPGWVWEASVLVDAARRLRSIHDASIEFPRDGPWRGPSHEPMEVICHSDFAPYNLVFNEGVLTGVIDWDYAAPGSRAWDLSYLAYRIVPLNDRETDFAATKRAERLQLLLDSYGADLSAEVVVETAIDRLEELAAFSERESTMQNRPELMEHAALYRRDAESLRP